MQRLINASRLALAALLLVAALTACGGGHTEKDFVGKWKSSRLPVPIQLLENGEWELIGDYSDGVQYGVWQYFDGKIMWSYIFDTAMSHDTNRVVSVAPGEFRLRERDGTITTFTRLD